MDDFNGCWTLERSNLQERERRFLSDIEKVINRSVRRWIPLRNEMVSANEAGIVPVSAPERIALGRRI
jgi:hypothetical protein